MDCKSTKKFTFLYLLLQPFLNILIYLHYYDLNPY